MLLEKAPKTILCADGKDEKPEVERLLNQLQSNSRRDFASVALVGIMPYRRQRNEVDCILVLSFAEEGAQNEYVTTVGHEQFLLDAKTNRYMPVGSKLKLNSFCISIEIKSHNRDGIEIRGNDLYVKYGQGFGCVNSKFIGQANSAREFLLKQIGIPVKNVIPMVYLPEVKTSQISVTTSTSALVDAIIFQDTNLEQLISKLVSQSGSRSYQDRSIGFAGEHEINVHDPKQRKLFADFAKSMEPSFLEQQRLELMSRKEVQFDENWAESLGIRMLEMVGRAGTGKTLRLISACLEIATQRFERVVFLTFNAALAADVYRMLELQNNPGGPNLHISTISRLVRSLAEDLNLIASNEGLQTPDATPEDADLLLNILLAELDNPDIVSSIRNNPFFSFKYAAIDEAQDWLPKERELIMKLFPPERLIVAAGFDQCLRTSAIADWKTEAETHGAKVKLVPLTKGIRQKANLTTFCNSFANGMNMDWTLEANLDAIGGEIILFNKFDDTVMEQFLTELHDAKNGYAPIDFLIIGSGKQSDEAVSHMTGKNLRISDMRGNSADMELLTNRMMRAVSHGNSRGLEAWATIITDLDGWYAFFLKQVEAYRRNNKAFLYGELIEDDFRHFPSWFLIPFTRAKNRILIQLPTEPRIRSLLVGCVERFSFVREIRN